MRKRRHHQDYQHFWPTVSAELIQHPTKRMMLPVLDLDPTVLRPAAVDPVPMLRGQSLQAHQAGVAEQLRPISPCLNGTRWMPSTCSANSNAFLSMMAR